MFRMFLTGIMLMLGAMLAFYVVVWVLFGGVLVKVTP